MRKIHGAAGVMFVSLAVGTWVVAARAQQQGAVERAGEKIDEVGRAIKKGLQNAEETVREGFHRSRELVQGMGVMSRVYGRLHWDKWLQSCPLNLKVEGGIVTLRGTVPDAAARAKAVALTRDTVGVTQVIDQLDVVPPSPTEPIPATSKP
jgi:hypothetical protein